MRQEMNPHQKLIQRQVEIESLYSKIEKKVNKELFEEIADRLMAKLPKMIVDHNFPFLLSDNAKNLYDAACKTLSNYSKCPKNDLEIQNYCNFASIISENVISLLHNSLEHPKIKPKNRAIVPLKTVQRNKDLMEIADEIVAQRI